MIERFFSYNEFRVGVISDTHIPDRVRSLPQGVLDGLLSNKVDLILHAGDISIPRVLSELGAIAPVLAVKGNRDLAFGNDLPISRSLEINEYKVLLTHGHMNIFTYWVDKFQHLALGYRSDRYIKRLVNAAPDASVFIFGHSHSVEEIRRDGKLFFNPGSATFSLLPETRKSWGLLTFSKNSITSKVFYLDKLSN
jgi:putative phosphoesterase